MQTVHIALANTNQVPAVVTPLTINMEILRSLEAIKCDIRVTTEELQAIEGIQSNIFVCDVLNQLARMNQLSMVISSLDDNLVYTSALDENEYCAISRCNVRSFDGVMDLIVDKRSISLVSKQDW